MYIILDNQALSEVLNELNIVYDEICEITLDKKTIMHTDTKAFYVKESDSTTNAKVVKLSEDGTWRLDEFLNPVEYKKNLYEVNGLEEVYYYTLRSDVENNHSITLEEVKRNREENLQLNQSDIYLMLPGKLEEGAWDGIISEDNDFFDAFKNEIDIRIQEEYNSDFSKKINRKCIASVTLKINDFLNGQTYLQKAIIGIAAHDTGFCIVEVMVPNCNIGGNKLLNYYCGNQVKIICGDKEYNFQDFLASIKVREYGKKRSIVFSYSDVPEQEIINALANEEYPMGTIAGIFKDKVRTQNIAQYDTAKVYVSSETMLEKCREVDNRIDYRLSYHAIELFFVELLLFQDAAVDKVYFDLRKEEERQREYGDVKEARIHCEHLSFDMAQAMRFGDFEQFNFPTTRESAKNIAKGFGINAIFEKYKLNKEFLVAMINANDRQMQEEQEELKNKFLMVISAIAFLGTLGEIIYNIVSNVTVGRMSYSFSLIVMLVGYSVYLIVESLRRKRRQGKSRK